MTRRRGSITGLGVLALLAGTLAGPVPPAEATAKPAGVTWGACPAYSDGAIASLVPEELIPDFRALLTRTSCGVVRVPLDYRDPGGRTIDVAITRLAAADQRHRLGSLAVNPGGPGGSGYLMPHLLTLQSPQVAELTDRYDLIGFDPRGVGKSTRTTCATPDTRPPEIPDGPITEATARKIYDFQTLVNQTCWQSNPVFLAQLTTANVARDLDRIRGALGEQKINYLGFSWGTLLGAVHRSLFPRTVGRMWLDSVVGPDGNRLDVRAHDTVAAMENATTRWADWAAERDATYQLGGTATEVLALVRQLKAKLDANPITFSDVPDARLDGRFISFLAATAPSPLWIDSTTALQQMVTAVDGEPAPPAVAPIITPGEDDGDEPPADAPERFNDVANTAILCNDDTGPHDFATVWSNYQSWQVDFPIAGRLGWETEPCAGWPVPARPFQLRKAAGSLVMSGHRWEAPTPYPWVGQMRSTIGGTVFTVEDDIHGSVPAVAECAEQLKGYFLTGRLSASGCAGVPPADTGTAGTAETSAAVEEVLSVSADSRWSWPGWNR